MAVMRHGGARVRGLLVAAAAAVLVAPAATAVAPPAPAPHFDCPWSTTVAPLCLAYDAQSLADAFGAQGPVERGYLRTVLPANLGPEAGRPAYAVFVHGTFVTFPDTEAVTGWIVAFLERAGGQVRLIDGPGVRALGEVVPPGAGPVHALPAPPPWSPACAARAFAVAQRTFAPRLARARAAVARAVTVATRRRERAVLARLLRQAAVYPNTVGRRTCTAQPATSAPQPAPAPY